MKQKFNIDGMSCAACSASVEKAVSRIDGVKKADVNLMAKTMLCVYDEQKVTQERIIKAVEKAGFTAYTEEEQKPASDGFTPVKTRLIVSICFLVVLMYISMGHMLSFPLTDIFHHTENAVAFGLTQFLLTLPVLYVNRKFFIIGFKALWHRSPNMDSLVAVGSAAAVIYGIFSIYMMAYGVGTQNNELVHSYMSNLYFESAAMILTLVTVGKYLESRSSSKTNSAIKKLLDLSPKTAIVLRDGKEIEVAAADIALGDSVVIKPGSKIPVDGEVISGNSTVDTSALTGESVPVDKTQGDTVLSASQNIGGNMIIKATKVGKDTTLAEIIRLVEEAGASKAPVARLADKISGIFVPIVMAIAIVAAAIWFIAGYGIEFSLGIGISVLVVSCPCALGLATPVAITVAMGKSAENGVLIKSAEALEIMHSVNTVVLDKTGTITAGTPSVTDVVSNGNDDELLAVAAALEAPSEHPLSKAVVAYAPPQNAAAEGFEAVFGKGVRAKISGHMCYGGNGAFMAELGIDVSAFESAANALAADGKTPLFFAREKSLLGIIAVADTVKPTSRQAIDALKKQGIEVIMLTGDNKITAEAIKKQLSLDSVFAEVLPADKEKIVAKLKESNKIVAMVGDGINDSPALSRADAGIAVRSGSDIAIDSADIILMKNDLTDVAKSITFGKRVMRNIKQNLFWAFFYNTLGIPLAAGVLFLPFGITLSPMIAAAAMSLSSVFVVTNALRLYRSK